MNEEWRPVSGYEGLYEVSDLGRVRSLRRIVTMRREVPEMLLQTPINQDGYPRATLHRENSKQISEPVHRMVALAFLGPKSVNAQVCHRDGNPSNNRLENLYWGTAKTNHEDAKRHNRTKWGEAKLTWAEVNGIRACVARGLSHRKTAARFGVEKATVTSIVSERSWKMDSDLRRRNFTWSYSSLRNFETCAMRYYHYDILRDIKETESLPLVEGKKVHDAFRAHVGEGTPLPTGLTMFAPVLGRLAQARGEVSTEQKLALTEGLKPTAFFGPGVWFRTVLDYLNVNNSNAMVIDYKTGKPRDGEELQLELAACTIFAHSPEVLKVKTGFLYTQTEQVVQHQYTRDDAMGIWEKVLPRVNRMLQAQIDNDYQPRPGFLCKKWCAVHTCKYNGV